MIARVMTTPQATPPMCSAMVLRSNCIRVLLDWILGWFRGAPQESLKFTVTVMMTGTGTPLRRVGV